MKYLSRLALLACFAALLCWSVTPLAQVKRHFTVRDSIEMVAFSRNPGTGRYEEVSFSPDDRYFALITTRGLLQPNQIESIIWLFETSAVKSSIAQSQGTQRPQPKPLVSMAGFSGHDQVNDDSIVNMRWAPDGRSIIFLGRNGKPERHLYVVDVTNGKVRQLTPDGQDVREFEQRNDEFVYTQVESVGDSELYNAASPALPDIEIGTALSLDALLFLKWQEWLWEKHPRHMWVVRDGKPSPVIDNATGKPISFRTDWFGSLCSISPSGRYVVGKSYAERVPRAWEFYQPAYESPETTIVADEPNKEPRFNAARPQQYDLVDLQTSRISVLIDAPLGRVAGYGYADQTVVAWSADEQVVALPNTFLALNQPAPSGRPNPRRPCIAVVGIATKEAEGVKESPLIDLKQGPAEILVLRDLQWQENDQQLVAKYSKFEGEDLLPEVFQRSDGHWKPIGDLGAPKSATLRHSGNRVSVTVYEGINEPPVLTASDVEAGKPRPIWNPNPQLAEIDLGEATVYRWHDQAGDEWTGGLVKPPGYVLGKKYPLVIQTHGFNQNEFLADGFCPTANAARPLASRGIIVLQVGEVERHYGTPVEAELDGRAAYVSAIEQLDAEGLINPKKVGIIGFSFTGWYVLDSLIHTPKYFAAATLAEFSSASFWQYLTSADYLSTRGTKELANQVGIEPFGDGLNRWLVASPGFNTDKIAAPHPSESNYPPKLIFYWDIYAALRLQGKPVELVYMRSGDHVLTKPLERLASQDITVDWYDFWLNAHEDPNPAKAGQYARWRQLRKK